GMLWAGGLPVDGAPGNPYPARVVNLSLGGGNTCPQSYQDAINRLRARDVLVVASVGNDGSIVETPANCAGVAGIAAIRHLGTKVGFSNLGPEVALSAPGGNCVNVDPGAPCLYSIDTTTNLGTTTPTTDTYTDQYHINVGTSFSAPVVSGIAGLMLGVNGRLSTMQLIARLQEGAKKPFPTSSDPTVPVCHVPTSAADVQVSECVCTTQTCGAGMANARGAVQAALRPVAAVSVPGSVSPGQDVVLRGAGSGAACGRAIGAFEWTIVAGGAPGIVGANTDTAVVVAPASGSFTVRLAVTDDLGRQDAADVIVTPTRASTAAPASAGPVACLPPLVAISLSPLAATVQAGVGTQAFSASVANAGNGGVTWYVNDVPGGNAIVGTVSASGVYASPASRPDPATVTVKAVPDADSTRYASAAVTITSAPSSGSGGGGGGGGGGATGPCMLLLVALAACRRRGPSKRTGRMSVGG
ncbi:MAG: S8 family serine peptidase, partial [Steroidobacteraceae bacterium]|nr:S8 family serine peptidase [Steroidobacteraceae bacterium]